MHELGSTILPDRNHRKDDWHHKQEQEGHAERYVEAARISNEKSAHVRKRNQCAVDAS